MIGLAMFVLARVLGPKRQTITVNVTRAGVPIRNLPLELKFDDEFSCAPKLGSYYRTGFTDETGMASWSRSLPREHQGRWRGRRFKGFFDKLLLPQPPPRESVRVCAVVDDVERVIFSEGQELKEVRPLDVTCDLAQDFSLPCYGVLRFSIDRAVASCIFFPLWCFLGLAMHRAPDRPMQKDAFGLGGSLVICLLADLLQRFWLVAQVLSVVSVLAVVAALALTLGANHEHRTLDRA
jgi:hypothetical protein